MSIQDALHDLNRIQEEMDVLHGQFLKIQDDLEKMTQLAENYRQGWEESRRREMAMREKLDLHIKATLRRETGRRDP